MICSVCGSEMHWQCDYDYEDYGCDGDGIVSVWDCPKCGTEFVVYMPSDANVSSEELVFENDDSLNSCDSYLDWLECIKFHDLKLHPENVSRCDSPKEEIAYKNGWNEAIDLILESASNFVRNKCCGKCCSCSFKNEENTIHE